VTDSFMSPVRERVYRMLRDGVSEAEIARQLRRGNKSDAANAAQLISLARDRIDFEDGGGRVRWKGPWPISYIRGDGQRVYRVGAGHDVPEHSLRALGFRES
jgi:hypothetical protein